MARFDPLNAVSKGNVMEFITALMTLATVTLAGIGGLYYPYACSVMPGLRGTDAGHYCPCLLHRHVGHYRTREYPPE
ncbi:hypothetical protein [Pseudarthrobacter sp. IC2-21]|jgi:hypothetical protein|uniref:hypothetical protein n=1 Tax=Pseudarthrobacter sp. IC2-21 TaxID=3092262 RepID=UPI002A6B44A5|nr:hypothetical protein [Pseudarthrobacter sp. IC2-21]